MIDYDKLKLAHESAYIRCNETGGRTDVTCIFYDTCSEPEYHFVDYTSDKDYIFYEIEDLIAKIKELNNQHKPKPKYKLAWFLMDGHINTTEVTNQEGFVSCDNTIPIAFGRTMYNSKKELIESQIEHWKNMRTKESVTIGESTIKAHENGLKLAEQIEAGNKRIDEILQENQECPLCGQLSPYLFPIPTKCQHESDTSTHNFSHPGEDGQLIMNKCKKCGEFYK